MASRDLGDVLRVGRDEIERTFPSLAERFPYAKFERVVSADLLKWRPVENRSTAEGHPRESYDLYVVAGRDISLVPLKRTPTVIYPPQYLYGGSDGMGFPSDESGESETIEAALGRTALSDVTLVVIHCSGRTTSPYRKFDRVVLADPAVLWNSIYRHDQFEHTCSLLLPDFDAISQELIAHVNGHPEILRKLHWRNFELLLDAIFRNHGYQTMIGPGSGDQGVDLRLIRKDSIGQMLTLVQAKRYAQDRPIALEAVAALVALVDVHRANSGLFVTTSRYAPAAREFAAQQGHRLVLATSDDVAAWCAAIR